MNVVNRDALPKGTKLQGGKFIVDCLFSDQGGFSLIYEGRAIRKVEDEFFGSSRVNIIEEDVIIKELYFRDKSERREGQTALTWHPKDKNDKELIKTFKEKTKSEAEKLARLVEKTPYIIVIYAAFEENNTVYLITKKIEGAKDFRKIIKGDKKKAIAPEKLELKTSLRYIHNVCEALKVVHNNNIIHLDIKPSNILRDEKDNAVLIDFGISVTVETGQIKTLLDGAISPHYSPPEQGSKDKKNIGFYSDIYALGATMYFFFTGGHLPPEYGDLISSGETFLPPSHYNDEVSEYLDSVVIKCLSLSFRDRYQTMEELIEALKGEKKYNTLVAEAHKALSDKKYEKGIEAIVATESLIPLSIELQSLKHELQRGREKEQKEEENKKQIINAERLIAQQKYKEAIDLLQLLPENASIKQKIAYCEKQLVEQQFAKLLADAAAYESNNNHQKALDTYLEAKKLKQNDEEVNSKIDSLSLLIVEMKERRDINDALNRFENKQLSFEQLKAIIEEYLQKHPHDNEIAKKWKALQAKKTVDGKENEAQHLQYLENALTAKSKDSALDWLRKIPSHSQYYDEAQQKIYDINNLPAVEKDKETEQTIISENKTSYQDADTTRIVSSTPPPPKPKSEIPPSTNTVYTSTKEKEADEIVNSETNYKDKNAGNFDPAKALKTGCFGFLGFCLLLIIIGIISNNEPLGTSIDENSFEYVKSEAEKGDVDAMNSLGVMYYHGEGVSQDYAQAKQWYEKAAEYGNANAMNNLGVMYYHGEGVSQDYDQAKQWYEKAAENGNTDSMYTLGYLYANGQGVTQNYTTAKHWYEKAADGGHSSAMVNLGVMYSNGNGVSQDYAEAKQWYEKAVEKGNPVAMNNIGILYEYGLGVAQDFSQAKQWYEKAADGGHSNAMVSLGLMYHNGNGVSQDYAEAKQWYEKAAEKGNAGALYNLGFMYYDGIGVEKDMTKAIQLIKQSANLGLELAQEALEDLGETW